MGDASIIADGGRLVVEAGDRTIGVFRVAGRLYAYDNSCPHKGGPACQGVMVSRVLEVLDENCAARGFDFDDSDPHVVCPWHGFEFSITTGRHAGVAEIGLTALPIEEQNGRVYVTI